MFIIEFTFQLNIHFEKSQFLFHLCVFFRLFPGCQGNIFQNNMHSVSFYESLLFLIVVERGNNEQK